MGKSSSVVRTEDGSSTLISTIFHEKYHSKYGATTESQVVFIDAGLVDATRRCDEVRILEMGFGTGLNALMSWDYADKHRVKVKYVGFEKFPITADLASELNYGVSYKTQEEFAKLHDLSERLEKKLSPNFSFSKFHEDINTLDKKDYFDVVYFDAFAPAAQEELWTVELFSKMYDCLRENGTLVTYCAKGQVKRNLKSAGFEIESLPGPPGKREMTRAIKL